MNDLMDPGIYDPYAGGYSEYPAWVSMNEKTNSGTSPSVDFSGFGSLFGSVATTVAQTFRDKTLMQQNQQGQAYIEGQRLAAIRAQSVGGFSTNTLLLIAGAVAVAVMLKG